MLLFLHLIGAAVWTGGHLVLSISVLPGVLKSGAPSALLAFESAYERLGMSALLLQIVTGLMLAYRVVPDTGLWFDWSNVASRPIIIKLGLLALTVTLAMDARLRVIPRLTPERLTDMALHVFGVTVLSVLFVAAGVSYRTGWLL